MIPFRQLPGACLALVLTALLSGCASIGAPLPPSLELPRPPGDLRASRKGNQVTLSWSVPERTIDRQTVRHRGATVVCRSLQLAMAECGSPIGTLPPDIVSGNPLPKRLEDSFTDQLPWDLQQQNPTRTITYAVEALNDSNRGAGLSNQVQVPLAPTLPPPSAFQAQLTADGVVLTWTGELLSLTQSPLNYIDRVYRRTDGTAERTVIGEAQRGADLHPTLVDHTFAWEKHYQYWITTVTQVNATNLPCATESRTPCPNRVEVEGDDSPALQVFTHDVFPPAIPTGLQAVFSGPGQTPFIDLVWAPDTDPDLAGYNIYRHEESGSPQKINSTLIKSPSYRDQNVASGKTYFYSVSAVDEHGNESTRSDEASETVP